VNGSSLISVIGAFSVTLGMLAIAVFLLKRIQGAGAGTGVSVPLQVLKRISIGPKQGVVLLRVGERVLVLSTHDKGSQLLTELTDEALQEALRPPVHANPVARIGALKWSKMLGIGLALALALSAAAPPAPAANVGNPIAQAMIAAPPTVTGPAQPVVPQVDIKVGDGPNALHLTGAVGLVVLVGVMTLLPALFLLMTSFTRILIVLQFLRPAIGTQTAPPGQLLAALAVLLTGVVMGPVLQEANRSALQPYLKGQISQVQAFRQGVQPFREFMLANTREKDLATFAELSGKEDLASIEEIPTITLVTAFVTSELRTAFQMGFVIFIPFIVVDIIVASVLMSLGMFMLPPMMVSLPFKLLLFVLADGWTLVARNLVTSFR
jgi:flagellar biosynthesis protein FliP